MIMYTSKVSPKNNICFSSVSQSDADNKALLLDQHNCNNCINCYACSNCNNCIDCYDCVNCIDCNNCINCDNCNNCNNCTNCNNCNNCVNCNYCNNCNNCSNCVSCDSCINCNDCYDCNNCNNCVNCVNCINCNDCTSNPIQLLGLLWIVTIRGKSDNYKIKIGCQDHSYKFWETVSDDTVTKMDSRAVGFWATYKPIILSISKSLQEQNAQNI